MASECRVQGRCLAAAAAVLVVFTLGACGDGDGGGLSDRTATRTDVSLPTSLPERSERTQATVTDEVPASTPAARTETAPPDTSGDEPGATRPSETVTVKTTAPRDTVTVVETEQERETSEAAAPTAAESQQGTAAEQAASADDTPWPWIALAVALVGIALIAFVLWRRRRAAKRTWAMRMDAVVRRTLATLDEVVAAGSVVTGRVEALAADARLLETQASDEPARASAGALRAGLDDLARMLESDRRRRLGSPPPPSEEQLAYSTALIREQVEQLRARLVPPEPTGEPPPP
jgi:hypothetical protein